jgi:hypothetical protein
MLRYLSLALMLSACDPSTSDDFVEADTGLASRQGTLEVLANNQRVCRFDDGTVQACCVGGATDPFYGVSCSFCGQTEAGAWTCNDRHGNTGTVTRAGVR